MPKRLAINFGEWFFSVEPKADGWGEAKGKDGEYGLVCTSNGETYILSNEVAKTRYPFLVDQFTLNTADGSAAAG